MFITAKESGKIKVIYWDQEGALKAMEKDYRSMSEMFSESAPNWKEIIELIKKFELEFNKVKSFL